MEVYLSISQNILSFVVEKIFEFKVDSCPKKNKSRSLNIRLISSAVPLMRAYHYG